MPRIIKATDYGYRKVVLVSLNAGEPEWVHTVGEQQRDGDGKLVVDALNNPVIIKSTLAPTEHTGNYPPEAGKVTCYNCHSNWQMREHIFEGKWLKATDEELVAEIKRRVALLAPGKTIPGLVGPEV